MVNISARRSTNSELHCVIWGRVKVKPFNQFGERLFPLHGGQRNLCFKCR
jgi:hypothetical protein